MNAELPETAKSFYTQFQLYVSSNKFHPTEHASLFFDLMSIHSFIPCQVEDEDGHAFASDTIRVCRR